MASSLQNQQTTAEKRRSLQDQANKLYTNRKVFQDLIHGKIELHPVCVRIINTPQFHRLRYIKQIGTCYYVYPTACHNRFEHSIGVCYLAGKLVRKLKERQPDENITDVDILCVEIAGICHDLGQGPFSHVFEKKFMPEMGINFSHKATARKMFEYMLEYGDERTLKDEIQNILNECQFPRFEENDFEFIKEMIGDPKDISTGLWPYKGRTEDKSFLYEIVANDRNGVDVDKWDCLARDSHMLRLHMTLDYERCFTSARVIQSNGADGSNGNNDEHALVPRKQICYREKDAIDLYDMFYARLNLHRRAYQHKTHTVIGLMICDVLKAANDSILIGGKKITETVDDMEAFTLLTDDVLQLIMHKKKEEDSRGKDNEQLDRAYQLIQDIMNRRLYKCVFETHCKDKKLTKADVLDGLKNCLKDKGVPENFFIVDVVKFNYGMENRNPLEKVRFYKKDELDKTFKLTKEQVSFVLPDTFEERIIRIYCNMKDDSEKEIVLKVAEPFAKWCKDNQCTDPEVKFHQRKPNIRDLSQPEGSDTHGILYERTHKPLPEPSSGLSSLDQPRSYDGEGIDVRSQTTDQ
ncbi:deoxynucleoside triphosphate triphosphohydrolase SAMHD1-like isoform X1 [Ruditapes philippinarum]|uniref:deoxynucleoside triphosphate triphosphohydrolase SAMHD1-like isoform X1 n=1 Tax=Ruditapes philippinarum TaxID=129788 RepID=UPI00295C2ACF|nr:deoxynucleoside triphosphate triphosphohydrolase SAMHD1-like isoform X1 [Ruditapes philippinarum]